MSKQGPVVLDIDGIELDDIDREVLSHPQVGGLILFSRNYQEPQQLRDLIRNVREVREDLLVCVDQEGGRVQRFREGFTRLPCLQKLGQLYLDRPDKALNDARELGWLMAAEIVSFDIDLSFAPVLDIDESSSVIIGDRSFSADPNIAINLSTSYIDGMRQAGMSATGKHFPGHGGVVEDSHLELPVDSRTMSELRDKDMRVFSELCPHLGAIMPAHIVFPDVDEHPVGFSKVWLKDVLKAELNFNGVIFSDDLAMEGAAVVGDFFSRAELAIQAGCDSVLVCNRRQEAELVLEFVESRQDLHIDSRLKLLKHNGRKVDTLNISPRWQSAQAIINDLV